MSGVKPKPVDPAQQQQIATMLETLRAIITDRIAALKAEFTLLQPLLENPRDPQAIAILFNKVGYMDAAGEPFFNMPDASVNNYVINFLDHMEILITEFIFLLDLCDKYERYGNNSKHQEQRQEIIDNIKDSINMRLLEEKISRAKIAALKAECGLPPTDETISEIAPLEILSELLKGHISRTQRFTEGLFQYSKTHGETFFAEDVREQLDKHFMAKFEQKMATLEKQRGFDSAALVTRYGYFKSRYHSLLTLAKKSTLEIRSIVAKSVDDTREKYAKKGVQLSDQEVIHKAYSEEFMQRTKELVLKNRHLHGQIYVLCSDFAAELKDAEQAAKALAAKQATATVTALQQKEPAPKQSSAPSNVTATQTKSTTDAVAAATLAAAVQEQQRIAAAAKEKEEQEKQQRIAEAAKEAELQREIAAENQARREARRAGRQKARAAQDGGSDPYESDPEDQVDFATFFSASATDVITPEQRLQKLKPQQLSKLQDLYAANSSELDQSKNYSVAELSKIAHQLGAEESELKGHGYFLFNTTKVGEKRSSAIASFASQHGGSQTSGELNGVYVRRFRSVLQNDLGITPALLDDFSAKKQAAHPKPTPHPG